MIDEFESITADFPEIGQGPSKRRFVPRVPAERLGHLSMSLQPAQTPDKVGQAQRSSYVPRHGELLNHGRVTQLNVLPGYDRRGRRLPDILVKALP